MFITLATFTVAASPVISLVFQTRPETGGLALVISTPWGQSIDQILQASAATDAYPGRAPVGAFTVIETDDTINLLYDNGAWLVLDGTRILELC